MSNIKKEFLNVTNLSFSYASHNSISKIQHFFSRNRTQGTQAQKEAFPQVLKNLSFLLKEGEYAVLGGASGGGKSTILRLLAGFEQPSQGTISMYKKIYSSPTVCVPPEKRSVGFLFQDHALFPQLTVEQNIQYGISHLPKDERYEKTVNILYKIKLAGYAKRYPDQLSIGQIQRVALARALVIDPRLLLLDEPFSSIDSATSFALIEELQEIKASNTTVIMVTHESTEAMYLADKIMLLSEGKIIQEGSPSQLYNSPKTHAIARYFDDVNFLPIQQSICGQLCSPCGFIPEEKVLNYQDFKTTKEFFVCVRPHMVDIRSNISARFQGENWLVEKKYFMGNHYKVIVESQHPMFRGLKIITLQDIGKQWPQEGEIVQLHINTDILCALDKCTI